MPLDPEQQAVVDAPVDANLLVEAGPGRGKTHVLTERIVRLIRDNECEAGEILVVSFSRAARDELIRRLHLMSEDTHVSAVNVRTLDSLASQMVLTAIGEVGGDFDQRIKEATEVAADDPEAAGILGYKHVLVDEAQDIVGVRAGFLIALWTAMPSAGFTVFADQAQAIYDFCLMDSPDGQHVADKTTSREMLECYLARDLPTQCQAVRLLNYYRSSDESLKSLCTEVWTNLSDQQHEVAKSTVDVMLRRLVPKPSLSDLGLRPHVAQSRAVLCPQNGQALYAATEAHKVGLRVRIQRRDNQGEAPAWLGRILLGKPQNFEISLGFLESLSADMLPLGATPVLLHQGLRLACRCGSSDPKVRQVVNAVKVAYPFEKYAQPVAADTVVFSTIHRSKGREFDEVAYLDWVPWEAEPSPGYDQRVRFVGLSRAKVRNFRIHATGPQSFKSVSGDRAMGFVGFGDKRKTWGMEIGLPGDLDALSFVKGANLGEVAQRQANMVSTALPGTAVKLVKGPPGSGGSMPVYSLYTVATQAKLGEAPGWFANVIRESLKEAQGWFTVFPSSIENLWIRGVHTTLPPAQAGQPFEGVPSEIIEGRLWVVPEVEGMGTFVW